MSSRTGGRNCLRAQEWQRTYYALEEQGTAEQHQLPAPALTCSTCHHLQEAVLAWAPQLSRSASTPSMAGSLMDHAIVEMMQQQQQPGAEQQTVALQTESPSGSRPSSPVGRPSRLGPARTQQSQQSQQPQQHQGHEPATQQVTGTPNNMSLHMLQGCSCLPVNQNLRSYRGLLHRDLDSYDLTIMSTLLQAPSEAAATGSMWPEKRTVSQLTEALSALMEQMPGSELSTSSTPSTRSRVG